MSTVEHAVARSTANTCACGAFKATRFPSCASCARKAPRRRATSDRRREAVAIVESIDAAFGSPAGDIDGTDYRGVEDRAAASEHSGLEERRPFVYSSRTADVSEPVATAAAPRNRTHRYLALDAELAGKRVIFSQVQPRAHKLHRDMFDADDRINTECDREITRLRARIEADRAAIAECVAEAQSLASLGRETGAPVWDDVRALWADVRSLAHRNRVARAWIAKIEKDIERAVDVERTFYIESEASYVESPDGPPSWQLRFDILSMYGAAAYEATFGEAPSEWLTAKLHPKTSAITARGKGRSR